MLALNLPGCILTAAILQCAPPPRLPLPSQQQQRSRHSEKNDDFPRVLHCLVRRLDLLPP